MQRWVGTAAVGFLAGAFWMLVLSQASYWLVVRFGLHPEAVLPVKGVSQEVRRVAVPLYVSGALWAGLCGAVAAVLVEWLFGRRTGLAGPVLFAAILLIFRRLQGGHLAFESVEFVLVFAIVWALGTWLVVVGIRLAAMRLQGRKG
jgi:hypothetical protein